MIEYKYLSQEQRDHFLEHGWIHIPAAIPKEHVDAWVENVWTRLGWDPNDKSTWTDELLWMPRHREMLNKEFFPKAWEAICELVGGEDRLDMNLSAYSGDQFILNMGTDHWETHDYSPREITGWHCDGDWYRHFLDAGNTAVVIIQVFTDIKPRGGGTYVCEDGIRGICQYLYNHPEGATCMVGRAAYLHIQECNVFTTFTANAGDTIILHPFLPHALGKNHLHNLRIIANPHVTLKEPFNLNRSNPEDYSLVEQVILKNLGRTSLPEWHVTAPRRVYYPRNYRKKLARVPDELQRMITVADEQGLGPESVDSIYLKGDAAIQEHNARNQGFLAPRLSDEEYIRVETEEPMGTGFNVKA